MTRLSPELEQSLKATSSPRQVLIVVRRSNNVTSQKEKSYYVAVRRLAEANRSRLIQALTEERAHDNRIEFNPIGMLDQVALRAPADVIFKIAGRQDVVEVILDEPTQVVDDLDW